MIVTKEQQYSLINEYTKVDRTTEEWLAFVQGIVKTLELIDKLMKNEK